jgi:acetate kinase
VSVPTLLLAFAGPNHVRLFPYIGTQRLGTGVIAGLGLQPRAQWRLADGAARHHHQWSAGQGPTDHAAGVAHLWAEWQRLHPDWQPTALGVRITHGGPAFRLPMSADTLTLPAIRQLTPLAPAHQPADLATLAALQALFPQLPAIVSFDTAFHLTLPAAVAHYALPRKLHELGVRRYGFHGLAFASVLHALRQRAPTVAEGRVIVLYLELEAAAVALRGGRCVDSSMGGTPLDGLPSCTQVGSLDPGVIMYLADQQEMTLNDMAALLYANAGWLGMSEVGVDLSEIWASPTLAAERTQAHLVYRWVREAGALASTLGGLDALVFAGPGWEHAPELRTAVAHGLGWLGVRIAHEGSDCLSVPEAAVSVWQLPTDADGVLARQVVEWLADE